MKKKMKKYAMVAINSKLSEDNEPVIRRVLIEYKDYKNNEFYKTKFITKDKYFTNENNSHQYKFLDDCYYMIRGTFDNYLSGMKRTYHYTTLTEKMLGFSLAPILFEAINEAEAIKKFHARKELRD